MSILPAEFSEFLAKYPTRKLKKGWPILYQGEVPRTAYVIKKGMIKVYDISTSGEEKVVTFDSVGDILPSSWVFKKSPVSLYYFDAFTDCEVYAVPRQALFDAIHAHKEILEYALDKYVSMYVTATLHIFALEQTKSSDKLLRILQYMAMRFGKEIKPGYKYIDVQLTHLDLAHMIGMTRETTSVELGKLRKANVISYKNQRYTLNVTKMQRILGADEFKSLDV